MSPELTLVRRAIVSCAAVTVGRRSCPNDRCLPPSRNQVCADDLLSTTAYCGAADIASDSLGQDESNDRYLKRRKGTSDPEATFLAKHETFRISSQPSSRQERAPWTSAASRQHVVRSPELTVD